MAGVTIRIILVNGNVEFREGATPVTGDIIAKRGHKITFECERPTALFIMDFVPARRAKVKLPFAFRSARGGQETPVDGFVFASGTNGEIRLKVKLLAKLGAYKYGLYVLDGNGHIVTLDPRIIID